MSWQSVHYLNYVCIEHRRVGRRGFPSQPAAPRCPDCGTTMKSIGSEWRVPPRSDARAWRALAREWRTTQWIHPAEALRVSEYRADYTPRRIVRRPGA